MDNEMLLRKLEGIRLRFDEIGQQLTDPAVISDMARFVKLNREYRDLESVVEVYLEFKKLLQDIQGAKDVLANEKDDDFRKMAREELDELTPRIAEMEENLKIQMLPKDPEDAKNAIIEIRAGTGGDEASIFAGDLCRMYLKYFETKGWKAEITNSSIGTSGGYKEIILAITGNGVYGILKYESGVHRVQRVPQTETQGRVHTSAATVAVLPEADEFEVDVRNEDIRKDTFCSSGPGGQSVNTTYSAIRLTHIPSGIVVQCQDEKSQIKNYEKALKELKTRIYNLEYQKHMDELASKRKTMVSTGDRSAKIRTYNYPQGRITDHRINFTLYNLSAAMDGDIQPVIDKLIMEENAERLREAGIE